MDANFFTTAANEVYADLPTSENKSSSSISWRFDAAGYRPDDLTVLEDDEPLKAKVSIEVENRLSALKAIPVLGGKKNYWISGEN